MKFTEGDKVVANYPSAILCDGSYGIFKHYTNQRFPTNVVGCIIEVKMLDGSSFDCWFFEHDLQLRES